MSGDCERVDGRDWNGVENGMGTGSGWAVEKVGTRINFKRPLKTVKYLGRANI